MTVLPDQNQATEIEWELRSDLAPDHKTAIEQTLPGLDDGKLLMVFRDVAAIVKGWKASVERRVPAAQATRRQWDKVAVHAVKLRDVLSELGGQTALDLVEAMQPELVGRSKRPPDTFTSWPELDDQLLTLAWTARFLASARPGGTKHHNYALGNAVAALVGVFLRADVGTNSVEQRKADFVRAGLLVGPAKLWNDSRDWDRLQRDYIKRVEVYTGGDGRALTRWSPPAKEDTGE